MTLRLNAGKTVHISCRSAYKKIDLNLNNVTKK